MDKNNEPLISIIIPVYNAEKYLSDCLQSLLAQTYQNFEIICVNDGSLDGSQKILKRYKLKDSRIQAYYKKNGGVSSARNFGLGRAKGDYIGFIDADDFVAPQYLEWLYEALCSCGTGISMCRYRYVTEGQEHCFTETCPEPEIVTVENYSWMSQHSGGHCWRMLTRKDVLADIQFDTNLFYGEDALFFMEEFLKEGRLAFLDCVLYDYMVWQESAVQKSSNSKIYTAFLAWTKVWEMVKDKSDPIRCTTEERYIMSCAEVFYRMKDSEILGKEQEKELLKAAHEHRRISWEIPNNQMSSKIQAITVGYCPYAGIWLWRFVRWLKNAGGKLGNSAKNN